MVSPGSSSFGEQLLTIFSLQLAESAQLTQTPAPECVLGNPDNFPLPVQQLRSADLQCSSNVQGHQSSYGPLCDKEQRS